MCHKSLLRYLQTFYRNEDDKKYACGPGDLLKLAMKR